MKLTKPAGLSLPACNVASARRLQIHEVLSSRTEPHPLPPGPCGGGRAAWRLPVAVSDSRPDPRATVGCPSTDLRADGPAGGPRAQAPTSALTLSPHPRGFMLPTAQSHEHRPSPSPSLSSLSLSKDQPLRARCCLSTWQLHDCSNKVTPRAPAGGGAENSH